MDSHLKETRLDGETVYQGGFLKVELDRVSLPDGTITKREYIRHPGAVVVLPVFDDGTVLRDPEFGGSDLLVTTAGVLAHEPGIEEVA